MIEFIVNKFPERRRRLLARLFLWGSTAFSIVLAIQLFLHLQSRKEYDNLFSDYFNAHETIAVLHKSINDSFHDACETDTRKYFLDGWNTTAMWLENIQHYGDTLGINVSYRIDSLYTIEGGDPSVKSMPIAFQIEANNRFDRILDFMKKLSGDTIAVRIDATEMIANTNGLADVRITITTWIQL